MNTATIPSDQCRKWIHGFFGGDVPGEILRDDRADSLVARLTLPDDRRVIMKLWARPGLRGALRRLTRSSPRFKEHRGLSRMQSIGVRAPAPLGHCSVAVVGQPWTDGILLGDLGRCTQAVVHIKRLLAAGHGAEAEAFWQEIVQMTRRIVDAGVLDRDHSLVNIIATPEEHAARLDLELANLKVRRRSWDQEYGAMIGRLIGTCAFAVQPDTDRVTDWARLLVDALQPPAAALEVAEAEVTGMLAWQRKTTGMNIHVELPWSSNPVR